MPPKDRDLTVDACLHRWSRSLCGAGVTGGPLLAGRLTHPLSGGLLLVLVVGLFTLPFEGGALALGSLAPSP